jgi:hypothetical protein
MRPKKEKPLKQLNNAELLQKVREAKGAAGE